MSDETTLQQLAGIDPVSDAWDQVFALRLGCGDYLKGQVERYGRRAILSIGRPDPNDDATIVWGWELPITARDLHNITERLAILARDIETKTDGVLTQAAQSRADLELKLATALRGDV